MSELTDIIRTLPGYDPYRDAAGYYFDEAAAQLAIDFYPECLVHVEGEMAWQPYVLETFEQAIIGNLMGWKRESDHLRRYNEVFEYVPRKNSKTTRAAGLSSLILFTDNEPGAQLGCISGEESQADRCFKVAKKMILSEWELIWNR